MDLSQVADDDYFGNNVTTRTVLTYAEIVSPQSQRHSYTSVTEKVKATDTQIEDDSAKATVSELTNTETTKSENWKPPDAQSKTNKARLNDSRTNSQNMKRRLLACKHRYRNRLTRIKTSNMKFKELSRNNTRYTPQICTTYTNE